MRVIWLTTQFPNGEKNKNGIFIFKTVKELSKKFNITVIVLHPQIPPILTMIKNFKNRMMIYRGWRDTYPRVPQKPIGAENFEVYYSNCFRLPRPKFQFFEAWGAYLNVKKIIRKYLNDDLIIHANWIFPEGHLAKILSIKFGIPFILTLRGSDLLYLRNNNLNKRFAQKVFNSANKITAVTESLFEKGKEEHLIFQRSKLVVINNFYDFENFIIRSRTECRKELNLPLNKKIILYTGAFRKIKNIYLLLDSLAIMKLEEIYDIILILAGYGYEESNLRLFVKEKKIEEIVKFVGNLNSDQLIKFYNAADLLCLPSFNEGFPNVIIESLMCGTPVVASSVGGIPKVIKDGLNGVLIDPKSAESLLKALKHCIDKDWDREKLRDSVSFLSPVNVIKQYTKLYEEVSKINYYVA